MAKQNKTVEDMLHDLAIRRAVILERLKTAGVGDYNKAIKKLEKIIRDAFAALDEDIQDLNKGEVQKFIAAVTNDFSTVMTAATAKLVEDLEDLAGYSAGAEAEDIESVFKKKNRPSLKVPGATKAYRAAVRRPMSTRGELLEPFLKDFTKGEVKRATGVIRKGYVDGQTGPQIVRSLIGTKKMNYKNGVLSTTRRNAEAMVRTSYQHVNSVARQEVWEANKDVIEAYIWVSTLDSRTTQQCKSLDGQEFKVGEGPLPPIHVNCRSTTVAKLTEKYAFLSEGRTRSSIEGYKPADLSYYEWLETQPKRVQDLALGPTRGQLFRDGGLSTEEFRKLNINRQFEPLTLQEMKQKDPKAFERAGL